MCFLAAGAATERQAVPRDQAGQAVPAACLLSDLPEADSGEAQHFEGNAMFAAVVLRRRGLCTELPQSVQTAFYRRLCEQAAPESIIKSGMQHVTACSLHRVYAYTNLHCCAGGLCRT